METDSRNYESEKESNYLSAHIKENYDNEKNENEQKEENKEYEEENNENNEDNQNDDNDLNVYLLNNLEQKIEIEFNAVIQGIKSI